MPEKTALYESKESGGRLSIFILRTFNQPFPKRGDGFLLYIKSMHGEELEDEMDKYSHRISVYWR